MEPADNSAPQQRDACLPWMLGIFFIGFFVLMLIVATGGYFIFILGVLGAIVLVAAMHYALWGRVMDDRVAVEREEEEAREDGAEDRWNGEGEGRFRRPG